MPKKLKYRKRITSFINYAIAPVTNNPELNNEISNSNNVPIVLKPSFPPILTINDLTKNVNTNNKPKFFPNAFIVYRMALMKEYRVKNYKLPLMSEISKIAKNSWNMEPKNIKDFYESLVKNAKSTYKKNNIQIVMDKHMNNVVNNQESVTCGAEIEKEKNIVEVQDVNNNIVSFPNNSSTNISSNFNTSTLNDQEYIRVLEQTIDLLLRN
ncbi:hypothetical protein RclHR1_28490001 [Rhizophagus clarus]|uniref:HMG box domain-containing protein n=1 Tax=Rhizophagus clarus TaxID=94130 RepID=A0A2Z6RHE4_9GLOM|nr:hypothetical protein RclHR1_28490001 [Rhizophagus clarus]GES90954.1 hypothetical protein GLOIN_2v192848 [Rhizophagus clarus]